MTPEDIKQLAIDIVDGKVFGSWMLPEKCQDLIPNIFVPLTLGAAERLPEDVWGLYSYLADAMPLTINGYPTFWKFRYLTKTDIEQLNPLIEKYRQIKKDFMA